MSGVPITVLWIVPILAFGFLLFLIALFAEKRSQQQRTEGDQGEQTAQAEPTARPPAPRAEGPEDRLGQIEGKLGTLTQSLHAQTTTVEQLQRENTLYAAEATDLKKRLKSLQREHDLVVSENYSLRAMVKKLKADMLKRNKAAAAKAEAAGKAPERGKVESDAEEMKLYDDTRLLKAAEDASERADEDAEELG